MFSVAAGESPAPLTWQRWGPPPERLPVGPSFSVDHVDLVNVALFTHSH
jgi:hypothetical protein